MSWKVEDAGRRMDLAVAKAMEWGEPTNPWHRGVECCELAEYFPPNSLFPRKGLPHFSTEVSDAMEWVWPRLSDLSYSDGWDKGNITIQRYYVDKVLVYFERTSRIFLNMNMEYHYHTKGPLPAALCTVLLNALGVPRVEEGVEGSATG